MPSLDLAEFTGARARFAPEADRESRTWVDGILARGAVHDETLGRLHAFLLNGARRELARRRASLPVDSAELDDLAHQAAADALMAIMAKIRQFRGDSRFTTWAYKFVVLEVATKVARHAWRSAGSVLDAHSWDTLPDRLGLGPLEHVEFQDLMRALGRAIENELTEHQRVIFVAIVSEGVPLDVLAAKLATNRNAIYKTLYDARRKLRANLVATGHLEIGPARRR